MQTITTALQSFAVAFAVCTTLAILVTGFFLGRSWLRGVGGDGALPGERDSASKHWRKP